MKKYPLSFYTDICFYFVAIYMLSLAMVFGLLPKPFSFIVSAGFSLGCTVLIAKLLKKRREKKYGEYLEKEKLSEVTTKLNCSSPKENCELFFAAFKALGEEPRKIVGGIFLPKKNTAVYVRFSFFKPEKKDVFRFANKKDAEFIELYSENFSDEVKAFSLRFSGRIALKDEKDAFKILKSADALPDTESVAPLLKTKKPSFDIRRLIDRKKAKNYLFFGITFMLFSFFAPIKLYYLIFGSAFLSLSLFIRLFGRETDC